MSKIQVKRAASTAWTAKNPVLSPGEFGFATEGILKIGDGVQSWNALSSIGGGAGTGGGWAVQGFGTYTQDSGTIQFADSNGITFGLSTNVMTASHDGLTTAAQVSHSHGNPTLNLTNVAGTTSSASNGLTLSLSVAAPGAGSGTALNLTNLTGTLSANTAGVSLSMSAAAPGAGGGFAAQGSGAYTQNTGTIQFANSNRVTFGLSTNQMTASIDAAGTGTSLNLTNLTGTLNVGSNGVALSMSAAAPGGGGGVNRSFFELMDGERITTCALLNNATYSNRPIFNPFWMDGSGLTCNTIRFFISRTGGTSLNVSIDVGFYTIANATSMNLISSTRHGYSLTTSGQFSGIRGFDITGLGQAGFSLSEGRYVLGFKMSMVSTASGGLNLMGGDAFNNVGWVLPGTNSTADSATNSHLLPFWGVYSATSANLPSAVGASNISGGNSARNPDIYAIIKEI